MFEMAQFIEECKEAVRENDKQKAVREVVARAVSDPAGIIKAVGEPSRASVDKLHHSPELTIINLVWAPYMTVMPHNHEMMAVIGIYSGREDNIFWRRLMDEPDGKIEAAGAKALSNGDATPLGPDIIHSVTNPIPRHTGAIHVYAGDFFGTDRSEWDPDALTEQPYDVQKTLRLFEEANG